MSTHSLRLLSRCSHTGLPSRRSDQLLRSAAPCLNSRAANVPAPIDRRSPLVASSCISRQFSSGSPLWVVSKDNIVRSPVPDVEIPTNEPFHSLIFEKCNEFKDKIAVEEFLTGKGYTFSQVKENAVKVASALHKLGYRKGDILLAYATNCCDYTILMIACSYLGVCFSAANPSLTPAELARQLEHSDTLAVFTVPPLTDNVKKALTHQDFSNKVKHLFVFGESEGFQPFQTLIDDDGKSAPDVDIDPMEDLFVMPYSSGTTGFPKGVMLTHYNCLANVLQVVPSIQISSVDRSIGLLPLYHIYGMIVVQFCNMHVGASVFFLPRFEPETFLQCIQEKKITFAPLVPPLMVFLAKHPMVSKYDLSSLKHVVSGAAPLGPEVSKEFLSKHSYVETLNQGYGLTETSPVTHIDTVSNLGTVGTLIANTIGKVVDLETQKTLSPGEEGELLVQGPQVMKGYYKNQKATDEMIVDGWLHTGDIGFFDEKGVFQIKDRLKELIKYKGNQVPPAELEAVLLGHPDIQDVAVIGIPDDVAGELPKAFVVKKPGSSVTEEDICTFLEDKVAPTKRLRGGVQFIEEVPKNPSGKILRRILRDNYVK